MDYQNLSAVSKQGAGPLRQIDGLTSLSHLNSNWDISNQSGVKEQMKGGNQIAKGTS